MAAAVAATAFTGLSITASAEDTECGVLINYNSNVTELTAASPSIADSGISFNTDTKTITFTKDTKLSGLPGDYYGSAFVCTDASGGIKKTGLTINIPSGVTVTCDNSTVSVNGYAYGIYLSNIGSVKVTGGGTLELNCRTNTGDCHGITDYGLPYFTLTADSATVKASGKYGFYNDGSDYNGYLSVTNGGVVELSGTEAAIKGSSAISYDSGATLEAGESAAAATRVEALDESSKFVRITAAGDVKTPTDVYVAGTPIYEETPTWTDGNVTAAYDKATNTLTLSGTGTISGPSNSETTVYGAAIYAKKALNIEVAEGADITLNAGQGDGDWCFGIYIYTSDARLTIGGSGNLTVTNNYNSVNSCAISPYGNSYPTDYALTLKDSVNVTANGRCQYGITVGTGGNGLGKVCVKDTASLTVQGNTQALYNASLANEDIYGGKSFAGSIGEKQISIAPLPAASYTQDTTSAFVGSDDTTGFITTVTASENLTLNSIKWNITSGSETRTRAPETTIPTITLDNGASTVFKVIVSGLKDENATAVAVVE